MKFNFFILFILFGNLVLSQKEITWEDLDCSFSESWSEEYNGTISTPIFESKQLVLDSTQVIISGIVDVVDRKANYYILSKFFIDFKGGKQEHSVERNQMIELKVNEWYPFQNGNTYKIKGTLILNENDVLKLIYTLENIEIIE